MRDINNGSQRSVLRFAQIWPDQLSGKEELPQTSLRLLQETGDAAAKAVLNVLVCQRDRFDVTRVDLNIIFMIYSPRLGKGFPKSVSKGLLRFAQIYSDQLSEVAEKFNIPRAFLLLEKGRESEKDWLSVRLNSKERFGFAGQRLVLIIIFMIQSS